jgi:linoleoyl-CoA desaturase
MHRYQHLYAWFFYGLSTLSWITVKDFVRLTRYYNMGLVGSRKTYYKQILRIAAWKIAYFTFMLVLPAVLSPFSFWLILLAFMTSQFVSGLTITMVFQTAHVVPETNFPLPNDKGEMENERLIHQMATTSNYAPKSSVFSWLIGGLNYQVEHHLFPNICHVHYKRISPIIKETAAEFNIPYLTKTTFIDAVKAHHQMLRHLGRVEAKTI